MKKRIKQKAEELFRSYGVKSVTMDEISAQLGISKKTLYQFFCDKGELVDEVVRQIVDYNVKTCEACKTQAENAIDEGYRAIEIMTKVMGEFNSAILFDLERGYPEIYERFKKYKYGFLYGLILENIRWGKDDGLFRQELDEEVYAKTRLEMVALPFNDRLFPKTEYSFSALQKELMEMYYRSMATPEGLEIMEQYQKVFLSTNSK